MKLNKTWFSIIEVIVGIFIFTIWLTAIYMTISSSININDYNKNQIIASNLSREWIELVKNLRDSNYTNLHNWDSINPNLTSDFSNPINKIQTWTYYKVEPDFSTLWTIFSVKLTKINSTDFWEWVSMLDTKMKNYELCIDTSNKYIHSNNCTLAWMKKSGFYRYIKFEDLKYKNASWTDVIVNDAYKVISKVIWFHRGYHETSITTIITDFKRL